LEAIEIGDELKLKPESTCFQLPHGSCVTAGNAEKGGAISAIYLN
jgi:hypothetical protein